MIDIDVVNFTIIIDAIFDAANCEMIGVWNILAGSTGGLAISNLEADPVFTLGSNYSHTLSAKLTDASGTSDQIKVTLNGTAKGAAINTPDDAALELLIIDIAADSWLSAASPGTSFFGTNATIGNVILLGSNSLTLHGGVAGDLVADSYNFNGFTGNMAVSMANNPGATNVSTLPRINRYIINDTAGGHNHAVTFAASHNNVTIDVNTIPALAALGTLTIIQGANNNDSITINLGGAGTGTGMITASDTEFLTINSGGTTANAIANVISNTGTPFVLDSVIVLGSQNITLGTVTTESLNASALTGTMSMTAAGSMQIIGGSNNDTITGSAAIDLIDGGPGADNITGSSGADSITGGSGNDMFVFISASDTGDTNTLPSDSSAAQFAGLDVIEDFTDGSDSIELNDTMTAGANFVFGSAGPSVIGTLAANTVYVLTSVGPGGADAIIYMNNTGASIGGGSATFASATLEIYMVGGNSVTWTAVDFVF